VRHWRAVAAAAVVLAVVAGGWRLLGAGADEDLDTVVMTERGLFARTAGGAEKWRHGFPGETVGPLFARPTNPTESLGSDGVLAGFASAQRDDHSAIRSGQLLWFSPAGAIKRSFSFEDRLGLGSREYSAPWALSDYQLSRGSRARLIAVAAHHFEWWPSIVTILDNDWRRKGSFVHAGWVEHLRWLQHDRLAVSGFSNVEDAGMVAVLDVNAMHGQGPGPSRSDFACTTCGSDRPLHYVVMPRSEVNRLGGAAFNRANMSIRPGALLVWTMESPQTATAPPAEALYEFTPQLELVNATYTDRYWEAHLELERLGKIGHTRQQCPDRDGPREIRAWKPATGWTTVPTAPLRARSALTAW
jgi:hypothetical protein